MKNRSKAKAAKWPFSFNEDWNGWGWSVLFGQLAIAFGFLLFGLHFAFASRQPGTYDFGPTSHYDSGTRAVASSDAAGNNSASTDAANAPASQADSATVANTNTAGPGSGRH